MMTLQEHNRQQLAIREQHAKAEELGQLARVTCQKCSKEMRHFPKGKKAEDAKAMKELEESAKKQGISSERVYCPGCGFEALKLTV